MTIEQRLLARRLLKLEMMLLETRAKVSRLQNPNLEGWTPEEIEAQDFEEKYSTLWYDSVINEHLNDD